MKTMDCAERNRQLKKLLKKDYPEVRVTGDRGTAYGWVSIRVSVPKPSTCSCNPLIPGYCQSCRDRWNQHYTRITTLAKGVEMYHYADDMGFNHSECTISICLV